MKSDYLRLLALASLLPFGACANEASGPAGPGLEISVAPLQLTGIGNACYQIRVAGAEGTVVDLDEICSGTYGNGAGGGISYVAPCDASAGADTDGDSTNGVQNAVTVWPALYSDAAANTELTGWQDPCGEAGCTVQADCNENADTFVEFNFTIMRDAQQGFFDVAVNFEDIFCSAKLDSCYEVGEVAPKVCEDGVMTRYADATNGKQAWVHYTGANFWRIAGDDCRTLATSGTSNGYDGSNLPDSFTVGGVVYTPTQGGTTSDKPIELLFGANGREQTAIAALACTAGPDSSGTSLIMLQPTVKCAGDVSFPLDLADATLGAAGNHTVTSGTAHLDYAIYFGNEDLDCGAGSCKKIYYNIAFNIADLASQNLNGCKLSYVASAIETPTTGYSESTLVTANGELGDPNAVYPAIVFGPIQSGGAPLTDAGGKALCFAHPLNQEGSIVKTGYLKGASFSDGNASEFKANYHFNGTTTGAFAAHQ